MHIHLTPHHPPAPTPGWRPLRRWRFLLACALALHAPGAVRAQNVSLDNGFTASTGYEGYVRSVIIQSDGKKLIGGLFNSVNGVARSSIARLNADDSLDTSFAASVDSLNTMVLQADGKVVIGGSFATVNGVARNGLARLNADGSLDASFVVALTYSGDAAAASLLGVASQPDGKLLVYGYFDSVNGVARNGFARLNADGSVDANFDPRRGDNSGLDPSDGGFAVQPDGKLLLVSSSVTSSGNESMRLVRLNADGSLDTGFNTDVAYIERTNTISPLADGKILVGGLFNKVGGATPGVARLYADGSVDATFDASVDPAGTVYGLVVQNDGKLLINGSFTSVNGVARAGLARLNTDGSLDSGFAAAAPAGGYVSGFLYGAILQADGKVLLAGGGLPENGDSGIPSEGPVDYRDLARLNADGSPDTGFTVKIGFSGFVRSVAVQNDGKKLVGGFFASVNGLAHNGLARLNADGSLDAGFVVKIDNVVLGENVNSVVAQADGKVLIGGVFYKVNGVAGSGLVRLNADGSLDPGFAAKIPVAVNTIAVQRDGKVLAGGSFSLSGGGHTDIARLNADGGLDTGFTASIDHVGGPDTSVNSVAVQADGKVLLGGAFDKISGVQRHGIARLNADGSVDNGFAAFTNKGESNFYYAGVVYSVAVQADGKVLLGGDFTSVNNVAHPGIARLNADGSLDSGFAASTDFSVRSVAVQADGKILVGGDFTRVNGAAYDGLARLNPDGSVDGSFVAKTNPYGTVYSVAVQPDGGVFVGGSFSAVNGEAHLGVALFTDFTPPAFFAGAQDVGRGVDYLGFADGGRFFGYYAYLADPHFIYHFDLGYEYVFDAADGLGGVYLYDFASQSFFYTSAKANPGVPFPYLYDFRLQAFLYYYPDPNNPGRYNTNGTRYFYNFATGKIITK